MPVDPTPNSQSANPILVYRDHLLRYSEIWVRLQGESLRGFRPYYAGSKMVTDVRTPEERTFVVNGGGQTGRAAELLFKKFGWAPHLYQWARQLSPALVHAHFGLDGALTLPLARSLGIPLVVTFHGYDVMTNDEFAARSFYLHRKYIRHRARLIREGTLFIAVSNFIRNLLLDQGFPPAQTFVHFIGVDIGYFTPNPAVPREPIVLFAGRLAPEKGCDYLIQAMAEVQRVHPDAELVVIGDGKERARLEQMAERNLARYRFLGAQPQDTIRSWLNRAKVLSVPSLRIANGEGEAFGLVFAEAQAMGVPVVSFASGGIPEAVAHGTTGFLAAERDWRSVARHITDLLSDRDLWQTMSHMARKRTSELFDLAVQTRALEDLYREALRRAAH